MVKALVEMPIRDRKIATIPEPLMRWFDAKVGDSFAFKKEKNHIIVGIIRRTIIEENIEFTID